MWDKIWSFTVEHYIFHTAVITSILMLIFGKKFHKINISKNGLTLEKNHLEEHCGGLVKEHEKRFDAIDSLFREDKAERKRRQAELDEVLRLTTLQACSANIYSPHTPALDALNSAIIYFKAHGNGNGREQVVKILMNNKENCKLWKSVINEDIRKNGICEDKYFQDTINWIEKEIK